MANAGDVVNSADVVMVLQEVVKKAGGTYTRFMWERKDGQQMAAPTFAFEPVRGANARFEDLV